MLLVEVENSISTGVKKYFWFYIPVIMMVIIKLSHHINE